ncbi:mitochondrial 37S ribosomal protein uS15m [Aspergillus undulatus]|uniref:mitochondrial 37S ribosomal protein uS15m n=1 Tax=Aspergillus undulatus TaxID=1810928 RepID=UPI003CCDFA32
MPPRVPFQPSLKPFTGSSYGQSPLARLSLNPSKTCMRAGSAEARERRRHDPFLISQSRQRKAANLSRRQALAEQRDGSVGDPIFGQSTPFVEELKIQPAGTGESYPNHYITPDELNRALEYSKSLAAPPENPNRATADPQLEKETAEQHLREHENAQEAINRIIDIKNGNTDDQMRLRIQKCIDTFGRHNTDQVLPPKPASVSENVHQSEKTPRVGPDTGSPEVQVAILTAKILNMSRHLEGTNKDKHNKRNMRLLVHKRQKLLRYLRKKERGGPRWQHLIETLGLSEASWKGEISM